MRAELLQAEHYPHKLVFPGEYAFTALADIHILTEDTSHIAAREEHSAAAARSGDRRFFVIMPCSARNERTGIRIADVIGQGETADAACASRNGTVSAAFERAGRAFSAVGIRFYCGKIDHWIIS